MLLALISILYIYLLDAELITAVLSSADSEKFNTSISKPTLME